ncbi:hypothetical protein [Prescottella equi]|uniref:DUF4253 domain-containing protein n=1 Tax=Prescottella equi ATCC 33707 TaxID=525370 RepID=E9T8A8_RHOHA|nr:hypothetical protein [Prescottella equi]EGD21338.1 hypothetical protein HMPREF0724_15014 [Prescottella equi ATCC 33707]
MSDTRQPHGDVAGAVVSALPDAGHRGVNRLSIAVVTEAQSFDALLAAFREIEAAHRNDGRCFLTLDDPNKCLYTSGHARGKHDLDGDVEYPDDETAEAVLAYDTAVFESARAVLADPDRAVRWEDVCGSLVTAPSDIEALVALNRDPGLVVDDVHVVQCLPTEDDIDLLADLPNGYFAGDWTPFESCAVARRMRERHGYELVGIGASTLGFLSVLDPEQRDVDALIADLRELYGQRDADAWNELGAVLRGSLVLLLGYTENFADLTEF